MRNPQFPRCLVFCLRGQVGAGRWVARPAIAPPLSERQFDRSGTTDGPRFCGSSTFRNANAEGKPRLRDRIIVPTEATSRRGCTYAIAPAEI